jgi:hypothetical protein
MDRHKPRTNSELFDYLRWLADTLASGGCPKLADEVRIASRFAAGSPSEFLHEAQTALKRVMSGDTPLTQAQLADVADAVEEIEGAFKTVGGA